MHFFISFVAFLGHHLAPDVSLQIFYFGGFPGVTEELHRLQSEQLLISGELSVLAQCVDADDKLDRAALKGLSFNLLPNLGLDVVGFAFGLHLLFELILMLHVVFFFIILDSHFFIYRD